MELIVIACLLAAPDKCEGHRLQVDMAGLSPAQCLYASPPQIAQWQMTHPKWKVKSWHCVLATGDKVI